MGGAVGAASQANKSADRFFSSYTPPPLPAGFQQAMPQASQQAPQQGTQFSPAVQQAAQQQVINQQQQMNPYFSQGASNYGPQQQGLQQLLGNMMSRYQQPQGMPQQQAPMQQMPMYQNPALAYRPSMQPAEQSLNRVAKSVVLQQKEAAEAELAKLKAEQEASNNDDAGFQAWQRQQYAASQYGGGG